MNTHKRLQTIREFLQDDLSRWLDAVLDGCSYRDLAEEQLWSQLGLDDDDNQLEEEDDDEVAMLHTPSDTSDNHRFEPNISTNKDESQDTSQTIHETDDCGTQPNTPASQPSKQYANVSIPTISHGRLLAPRNKRHIKPQKTANIVVVESPALCDKPIIEEVVCVDSETYSWVQCFHCGAWRLTPDSSGASLDPEWVCSDNSWEEVQDTCEANGEACDTFDVNTSNKIKNIQKRIHEDECKPSNKRVKHHHEPTPQPRMLLQQEDTKLDITEHDDESLSSNVKTPHMVHTTKRPRRLFAQMRTKQAEKKQKMDNRLHADNSRSTETKESENHSEADSGIKQRTPSIRIMERLHDQRHTSIVHSFISAKTPMPTTETLPDYDGNIDNTKLMQSIRLPRSSHELAPPLEAGCNTEVTKPESRRDRNNGQNLDAPEVDDCGVHDRFGQYSRGESILVECSNMNCNKWRLIPHTRKKTAKEKWTCEDNADDVLRNRCDVIQESWIAQIEFTNKRDTPSPASASSGSEGISEYEKVRNANVKRNAMVLGNLDFNPLGVAKKMATKRVIRRKLPESSEPNKTRRSSQRIHNKANDVTHITSQDEVEAVPDAEPSKETSGTLNSNTTWKIQNNRASTELKAGMRRGVHLQTSSTKAIRQRARPKGTPSSDDGLSTPESEKFQVLHLASCEKGSSDDGSTTTEFECLHDSRAKHTKQKYVEVNEQQNDTENSPIPTTERRKTNTLDKIHSTRSDSQHETKALLYDVNRNKSEAVTNYRKGAFSYSEHAYLNAINIEWNNKTLGIVPGLVKNVFLARSVNRILTNFSKYMKNGCPTIKPQRYSGIVRDPNVTQRLKIHRRKLGNCNMPSVEELLALFLPGGDVEQTYEKEPEIPDRAKTIQFPKEVWNPEGGVKLMSMGRVSKKEQKDIYLGLLLQKKKLVGHAYKHQTEGSYMIAPEGIRFFSEVHCAWDQVPETLLLLLCDPELSKCDENGRCIACNTLLVTCAERVMRNVEAFIPIRDALSARGINIWSISEGIGSLTHPDVFLQHMKGGWLDSKNKSDRNKANWANKGLPNCGETEPTQTTDPWGPSEIRFASPRFPRPCVDTKEI